MFALFGFILVIAIAVALAPIILGVSAPCSPYCSPRFSTWQLAVPSPQPSKISAESSRRTTHHATVWQWGARR